MALSLVRFKLESIRDGLVCYKFNSKKNQKYNDRLYGLCENSCHDRFRSRYRSRQMALSLVRFKLESIRDGLVCYKFNSKKNQKYNDRLYGLCENSCHDRFRSRYRSRQIQCFIRIKVDELIRGFKLGSKRSYMLKNASSVDISQQYSSMSRF